MKSKTVKTVIALSLMLPLMAQGAPPKPKITPQQACAAAVKKIPGKATSAKYEFEEGHWQYAVTVRAKSGLYEVEVNSTTGKVTDAEKTSAGEEAKEAAADKKAAAKGHAAPPPEKGEKNETDEKGG